MESTLADKRNSVANNIFSVLISDIKEGLRGMSMNAIRNKYKAICGDMDADIKGAETSFESLMKSHPEFFIFAGNGLWAAQQHESAKTHIERESGNKNQKGGNRGRQNPNTWNSNVQRGNVPGRQYAPRGTNFPQQNYYPPRGEQRYANNMNNSFAHESNGYHNIGYNNYNNEPRRRSLSPPNNPFSESRVQYNEKAAPRNDSNTGMDRPVPNRQRFGQNSASMSNVNQNGYTPPPSMPKLAQRFGVGKADSNVSPPPGLNESVPMAERQGFGASRQPNPDPRPRRMSATVLTEQPPPGLSMAPPPGIPVPTTLPMNRRTDESSANSLDGDTDKFTRSRLARVLVEYVRDQAQPPKISTALHDVTLNWPSLGCSKFVLTLILKHGGPLGLIQHLKSCKPMITNAIEVLPPRTDSKDREETLGFVGRSYRPEAATKGNTPPMAATKPTADSDDSDDGKGDATNDELAIATNLAKLPQNYEETIDQISDFFNYQFQSGPAREFALGLLTEQLMLGPVREMSTYAKMMFVVSCIRNDPLKTFAVKGCSANSLVTPHPDSQNSFVPLVKTAPSSNTSEASAKPEARKASFDVGSDGGSTNGGVNFSSRPPNDYVEPSPPTRVSPRNDMGNDNSGNWSQPLSLSNSFSGQPTHPINRGDPSPPLRTHGYHDRPQMNVTEYVRKNEPSPPMSYPIDPPISEIPRNPREWPRNVVNDIERLTEDYVLQRQVDEEPIFLDVVPTSMICLSEVFYVRNCDAIQTCEQIAIILGQVYDGAKNRVGLGWQRGDAAAAWTMPDEGRGMWRRVMIDRDLGHGQFDVHDVDTGRFFTVGDDVIFPLCDRLVEIPPLAFRCTLGDFVVAKAAIFRERSNIIIKKFEENGGRIELVRKLNDTFHVRLSMPNSEMHVLAYLRSVGIVNTLRKPHNYRY